jgi:hypothetical protein
LIKGTAGTVLILGGGGMVGIQVAREVARELEPKKIVLAAVTEGEVREAIRFLEEEIGADRLVAEWGNIFVPEELKHARRDEIASDAHNYDLLFESVFDRDADYRQSALYKMVERHKPDIVVDCINTATAISYQNEFELALQTKKQLDAVSERSGAIDRSELEPLIATVKQLLIAQGIPQIARHILLLQRTLDESPVQIYVKVGTTGTGGMGLNIPYTHSEDKPSLTLLAKSAIGFAHTGLLFLMARTPGTGEDHTAIVKEVKPGAMIGFRRVEKRHVRMRGESVPATLYEPKEQPLGDELQLAQNAVDYLPYHGGKPLEIIGADTGENGFFSVGEFQAITYPRQMEYVTPEEVARTVVLEILGASTGRDVLAAIDGAITEPSYRAGVLRDHAIREMRRLENKFPELPSIAVGHLGPPKLSKLLAEAYLIKEAAGEDIRQIVAIEPEEMQQRIEELLLSRPLVAASIVRIGIPILHERRDPNGIELTLTRGPRITIPPSTAGRSVAKLTPETIDRWAQQGWVDLRLANFERWRARLGGIERPDVETYGSAALDVKSYPGEKFVPGDIVGWIFTNEQDQGMVGRRLF